MMPISHVSKHLFHSGLRSSLCLCLLAAAGCATAQDSTQADKTELPVVAELQTEISAPISTPIVSELTAEEGLWQRPAQADEETYVVLLRHAIAPGTGDPENFQLDDCSTQRNLSEEGRQQAIAIGKAFQSRNVPVKAVLSSQWCRCLETAELMNVGPVEPFSALNSFFRDRNADND